MQTKEVLEQLKDMFEEDGCLDEKFDFAQMLDYLAIIGVECASESYQNTVRRRK